MASRLFHAIVGVGVSLGATASCAGVLVDERGGAGIDAAPLQPPGDAALADGGADPRRDAAADAPPDAAQDARLDAAFCDAPWPTTKGSDWNRPACTNPEGRCDADGGPDESRACIRFTGPYQCEEYEKLTWDLCVNDQWQCPPGSRRSTECKCWGPTPAGYVCTATGFKKIDGGP